jgi:hypothetical protein
MDIEDEEPWLRATIKRLRKAIPLVGNNHHAEATFHTLAKAMERRDWLRLSIGACIHLTRKSRPADESQRPAVGDCRGDHRLVAPFMNRPAYRQRRAASDFGDGIRGGAVVRWRPRFAATQPASPMRSRRAALQEHSTAMVCYVERRIYLAGLDHERHPVPALSPVQERSIFGTRLFVR